MRQHFSCLCRENIEYYSLSDQESSSDIPQRLKISQLNNEEVRMIIMHQLWFQSGC